MIRQQPTCPTALSAFRIRAPSARGQTGYCASMCPIPMSRRCAGSKSSRTPTNLTIVPASISDALDLSGHALDYAVAFRWGDYEIVCVQKYVNGEAETHNSIM